MYNTQDTHYVDELINEQHKGRKAVRAHYILKGLSLFVVACGIAFLLGAIGWYIIKSVKNNKPVAEQQQSSTQQPNILEKYDKGSPDGNIVSNYVIFHRDTTYVEKHGWEVVTGWRFKDNTQDKPYEQYCYIGKRIHRYDIEYRDESGNSTFNDDSDYDIWYELNINSNMIEKFRTKCIWFDMANTSADGTGTDNQESEEPNI